MYDILRDAHDDNGGTSSTAGRKPLDKDAIPILGDEVALQSISKKTIDIPSIVVTEMPDTAKTPKSTIPTATALLQAAAVRHDDHILASLLPISAYAQQLIVDNEELVRQKQIEIAEFMKKTKKELADAQKEVKRGKDLRKGVAQLIITYAKGKEELMNGEDAWFEGEEDDSDNDDEVDETVLANKHTEEA
jgi:hypothetical protein